MRVQRALNQRFARWFGYRVLAAQRTEPCMNKTLNFHAAWNVLWGFMFSLLSGEVVFFCHDFLRPCPNLKRITSDERPQR